MIIEWHTHVYPPEEAAAEARTWDGKSGPTWAGRCPMTVENVLDAHHKADIAVSIVSNAAHYMRGKDAEDELASIQRWTDYAAEIQETYKGTLYGLATILPCGGPAYLKEAERAIRGLGLKGLFINSSHKGHYPDDDEARPFWELVQDLDVPVMIHPPHVGFGIGNWTARIRAGTVRALAVDGEERSPLVPAVPTLRELGYQDVMTWVYFGLVAPAGTPKPILDRLYEQIAAIGRDPEFRQKRLIEAGLEPIFDTSAQFVRFLKDDRANSERIVKESGVEPQ